MTIAYKYYLYQLIKLTSKIDKSSVSLCCKVEEGSVLNKYSVSTSVNEIILRNDSAGIGISLAFSATEREEENPKASSIFLFVA